MYVYILQYACVSLSPSLPLSRARSLSRSLALSLSLFLSLSLSLYLGHQARVARLFEQEKDQPGRTEVLVIAFHEWQR